MKYILATTEWDIPTIIVDDLSKVNEVRLGFTEMYLSTAAISSCKCAVTHKYGQLIPAHQNCTHPSFASSRQVRQTLSHPIPVDKKQKEPSMLLSGLNRSDPSVYQLGIRKRTWR